MSHWADMCNNQCFHHTKIIQLIFFAFNSGKKRLFPTFNYTKSINLAAFIIVRYVFYVVKCILLSMPRVKFMILMVVCS